MKDKQLLTALELLNQKNGLKVSSIEGSIVISVDETLKTMIEFAKMHVEKALETASKKAKMKMSSCDDEHNLTVIDRDSILNAYSLENIK